MKGKLAVFLILICVSGLSFASSSFILGQGYDTDRSLALSGCVKNSSESVYNIPVSESELYLESSMSLDWFSRNLSISNSLWSDDKLTADSTFDIVATNDRYSHTYIYGSKYVDKIQTLRLDSIDNFSNYGKLVKEQGAKTFRAGCGNRFVKSTTLGGGLYFTVKLQFKNSDVKLKYLSKIGSDISAAKLSSSLYLELHRKGVEGSVIIRASQKGGLYTDLSRILSGLASNGVVSTSCGFDDLEECKNALNALTSYAAEDFPNQFISGAGEFAPIKYEMADYKSIWGSEYNFIDAEGYDPLAPGYLLTQEVREKRQDISDKIKRNLLYKDRINMLLIQDSTAQEGNKASELHAALTKVDNNLVELLDLQTSCNKYPDECLAAAQYVESNIEDIDESILINSYLVRTFENEKYKVGLFRRVSSAAQRHRDFSVEVPPDYFAIGGGAESNCSNGILLTASYPNTDLSSWIVSGKDHLYPCSGVIEAYAIGIKLKGITFDEAEPHFNVYHNRSGTAHHPKASVQVPMGAQMVSGGFNVSNPSGTNGNLGTASYPLNSNTWEARSKDHLYSSPDYVTAYAVAIDNYIEGVGYINVDISSSLSQSAQHPASTSYVSSGYILSGCGAFVDWSGAGNLLEVLTPNLGSNSCHASSKDHGRASPAKIKAYSLGLMFN